MAQHDYNLANQSGAAIRADLNDALAAIVSNNSGATEPATTFAYQLWADTTAAVLKQRNAANNAWVTLFKLADGAQPSVQTQLATRFTAGGTADAITGTLSPAIASYAAGLRVTTTPGGSNTVTGPTLNLNSLGTKTIKKRSTSGSKVALVAGDYNASGPFDLEYDGTDFILLNPVFSTMTATVGGLVPTPPNNTTTFLRGDGTFAAPATSGLTLGTAVSLTTQTAIDYTGLPAGIKRLTISFQGVSTNGTDRWLVQIGNTTFATTGYVGQAYSGAGGSANSSGFEINNNVVAANNHNGQIVITKVDTNTYAQFGIVASQTISNSLVNSGGSIALASELERVRITTASGANQFDAGKINIAYE